jgi:hypothetical protein
MSRLPRLVLPGHPHHVAQRGNRRERTFFGDVAMPSASICCTSTRGAPGRSFNPASAEASGRWQLGNNAPVTVIPTVIPAGTVAFASSPTVVGGVSAGGVAAGARFASGVAGLISAAIKLYQGDRQGALASVIGAAVGGGTATGKRIAAKLGADASPAAANVIGDAAGRVASKGVDGGVCEVR